MIKYYQKFVKLIFGLLIFLICISFGLILFYSEVYEFAIINKFRMTGKKRKRGSQKPNNMYKLQVLKFIKLYSTERQENPRARSGHRIVCKNASMYAIGGYNPDGLDDLFGQNTLFKEVWRFDFMSRTWKKLKVVSLPGELASNSAILWDNFLFLYGGTAIPFGERFNGTVYVCKLEDFNSKLIFKPLPTSEEVHPRNLYGQSIAIDGKYLYTVGGTDGFKYYMDVYRLNLSTNEWEKLFDQDQDNCDKCPEPRYRHEVVLYNNRLFVFGGGISYSAFELNDVPVFNLEKNQWTTLKTIGDDSLPPNDAFPSNRKCHGCVQDPHDKALIFINGGYNNNAAVYKDTWRMDLKTMKWKRIDSLNLPHGTYFHSTACTPDGRMVVYGGITNRRDPHERTADVYSTWIRIPRLSDACWEALDFYIRKKIIKLPNNLKSLELPIYDEMKLRSTVNLNFSNE